MAVPAPDHARQLLLALLGAAGPAVGAVLGIIVSRRMRGEVGLMLAIPLQSVVGIGWVGALIYFLDVKPVLVAAAWAIAMVVVGEVAILVAGLRGPPRPPRDAAFDVVPPRAARAKR